MSEKTALQKPPTKTIEPSAYTKLTNTGDDTDEEEWGGFDSPAIHGQDLGTPSQFTETPLTRKVGQKEKKTQKPNEKSNLRPQKSGNSEADRDLRDSNFKALNEEVAAESDGKPVQVDIAK